MNQTLAERGVRMTRARRAVVRALQRHSGPRSAADLHDDLRRRVPLSSLYRSLSVLEGAGVAVKRHDPTGVARFELAEWLTGHHDHLVCVSCGATEDVRLDSALEDEIAGFVASLGTSFEVVRHSLHLEGLCEECRR